MVRSRWLIIAYTDEATFEKDFPHRDASGSPGSTQFTQWIKIYSTQINGELQVESDVVAFGADTHTSNTVLDIINQLLEFKFIFFEDIDKTPLTERQNLQIPHIKDDRFLSFRKALEDLKGQIPTIVPDDPPAFNFDLNVTEGGFD